jgi:predicted transposase YbfD/YdcC
LATLFPPELIAAFHGQAPPASAVWDGPPADLETARTVEKGHGRIEQRELITSSEVAAYLGWPGASQICRIRRVREIAGEQSHELVYAVTSLTRHHASAAALLALNREHWAIENCLHWRRDVTFSEDASRIRCANAPQALASLRNTVLQLLRPFKAPIRATRQRLAENRIAAINLAIQGFL